MMAYVDRLERFPFPTRLVRVGPVDRFLRDLAHLRVGFDGSLNAHVVL
jgi:hypothetical protein